MLARVVSSAVFIALVSAQPEPASYSSSPSSTSNGYAAIHTVNVGRGNFQFDPNETYANPGDIVTFNFFPTNHSVVRAAYGLPCIPYEETGNNLTGFYSGNFLVDNLANPPQWNLTINDTQPAFYYCTATGSCITEGMVGVINPNASVSLQAQYEQALKSPYMLVPGQPFPSEGEGEGVAPTPLLTANPSLLTALPTGDATALAPGSTNVAPQAQSSSTHLSGGAIAGIVIAAVVFLALLAAVFWLLGHRRGSGSAAAGQSAWGKTSNNDRTEAWAAASSNGPPWGGASDVNRVSEMYQKPPPTDGFNREGASSPALSPGYMQPLGRPGLSSPGTTGHRHNPSEMSAISVKPPLPSELSGTGVTELEAPPTVKP